MKKVERFLSSKGRENKYRSQSSLVSAGGDWSPIRETKCGDSGAQNFSVRIRDPAIPKISFLDNSGTSSNTIESCGRKRKRERTSRANERERKSERAREREKERQSEREKERASESCEMKEREQASESCGTEKEQASERIVRDRERRSERANEKQRERMSHANKRKKERASDWEKETEQASEREREREREEKESNRSIPPFPNQRGNLEIWRWEKISTPFIHPANFSAITSDFVLLLQFGCKLSLSLYTLPSRFFLGRMASSFYSTDPIRLEWYIHLDSILSVICAREN